MHLPPVTRTAATQVLIETAADRPVFCDGEVVGAYLGSRYLDLEQLAASVDTWAAGGPAADGCWGRGEYQLFQTELTVSLAQPILDHVRRDS